MFKQKQTIILSFPDGEWLLTKKNKLYKVYSFK